MQKTVSMLIFENSFSFSCYKPPKFWNGSSDDFYEKGRENIRSSTAESTRLGCDVTWDQYQLTFLKDDTHNSCKIHLRLDKNDSKLRL